MHIDLLPVCHYDHVQHSGVKRKAENDLRSEERVCYSTELQTHEATSRLEYTISFRKNLQTTSNIMMAIWQVLSKA